MKRNNVYKLPVVEKSYILESKFPSSEKKEKEKEEALQRIIKESYQKGWDDALEKNREDVEFICQSLKKAIDSMEQERCNIWEACEKEMIKFTFAVAKKIIYEEVSQNNRRIIEHVVGDAINKVKKNNMLRVHLNPDDVEGLKAVKTDTLPDTGKKYEIVTDSDISRGGCRVVTDSGGVDATLETRWTEVIMAFDEHNVEEEECMA